MAQEAPLSRAKSGSDSRWERPAPRGVQGCHEPYVVHGARHLVHHSYLTRSPPWMVRAARISNNVGMPHIVYILRSLRQKKLYIGYTTNLERRIEEHNTGKSAATKPYAPWEMIFYETYNNSVDAKRREQYFKTSKGKSTLRMMLTETLKSSAAQPS